MSWLRLRLAGLSASAFIGILAACGGDVTPGSASSTTGTPSSSADVPGSGNNNGEAEGVGFGCCPLPARPEVCTLILGGTKHSADDSCILGFDGTWPDPDGPGWTVQNDENNCPIWVEPKPGTEPTICCGCPDAAAFPDASDAGDQ